MKEKVIVRQAHMGDAANLVVLKQQVWVATYAVEGIRDEFSEYLLNEFTIGNEKGILEDPGKITLVAEINHHLIGCAVIVKQTALPVAPHNRLPEISVLYVLERFTAKGIGKMLLDKAIDLAMSESVFLTVYHENKSAIRFYNRYGFKLIGQTYFSMGGNKYENKVLLFDNQSENN